MAVLLCHVDDIAEGEARGCDPDDAGRDRLFLVRRGGRLFAYLDDCPHVPGAAMAWRRNEYLSADGQLIACHGHGALFEVETGLCIHGPCLGRRLAPVAIEVTERGEVRAVT